MWCRRRESNDTRLLILRNLLQTYERKNRKTRCMPASYVQNHVQQIGRRVAGQVERDMAVCGVTAINPEVRPRPVVFNRTHVELPPTTRSEDTTGQRPLVISGGFAIRAFPMNRGDFGSARLAKNSFKALR